MIEHDALLPGDRCSAEATSVNTELLARVIASPRLPSLPAVALRIVDLVQQPDISLDALSEAISRDAALASKILKTANSSFYARSRRVTRLSEALVVLGLRRVKTLALGFTLIEDLRGKDDDGFDFTGFWLHSLYAATVSRSLAPAAGISAQQEEAFLAGLTHALGMLAMNQALGADYRKLVTAAGGSPLRLLAFEDAEYGLTHAEVGATMAEQWSLPRELIAAMRFSGTPDEAPEELRRLVRCAATGAHGADLLLGIAAGESLASFRKCCSEWIGIDDYAAEARLADAHAAGREIAALLDLPERRKLSVSQILSMANEALGEIALEIEDENIRLRAEQVALEQLAATDSLSGLANRRAFDEALEEHFAIAGHANVPLSLLLLDLDRFRSVNESHGHQSGDEVLRRVGEVIRTNIRGSDVGARYGGEEFAVILPGAGIRSAIAVAQRLRREIAAIPVDVRGGETLYVTASVGVATFTPGIERPEDLLDAADVALYDAKASGRNTVRIAEPHGPAAA